MTSDTIADMLTRIRNAQMRKQKVVELPYSKVNDAVLNVLNQNGFVGEVSTFKHKKKSFKSLSVALKYDETGQPAIRSLERISKPGLRQYREVSEIRPVLGGLGFYIVSTSRGVMTSLEAKKKNLGGEIICKVY